MDKVSVVIPTFNRYKYVMNTINSIKEQSYENIEIILVNDCSTENEYYSYDWKGNGVSVIHLNENTKNKFGFACGAYVRNVGIEKCTGKYVAFCDDDDIWFPKKLELQLEAMSKTGCKMSSTEGLIGNGIYNEKRSYKKYNSDYYFKPLYDIYENHLNTKSELFLKKIPFFKTMVTPKTDNMLKNGLPKIWTLDFLNVHNCVITSSVIIEKSLLNKINNFKNIRNGLEDYDCWQRALEHTNSVYVKEICFYYDLGHGDGQNW